MFFVLRKIELKLSDMRRRFKQKATIYEKNSLEKKKTGTFP